MRESPRGVDHLPERTGISLSVGSVDGVRFPTLAPRPRVPNDRCDHCGSTVDRVWLVPGDVVDSCRDCFTALTGREPVHAQGHSSGPADRADAVAVPSAAAFYPGARDRRTA